MLIFKVQLSKSNYTCLNIIKKISEMPRVKSEGGDLPHLYKGDELNIKLTKIN